VPAQDRRRRAAQEYGVSVERFRKYHERVILEQVAEEIIELCQPAATAPVRVAAPADLAGAIRMAARCGTATVAVTVHVEPVELLRDVDVIVSPANDYLELPQPYKASVSAALRRGAARRGADGAVVADEVADELRAWVARHARPGMPVAPGTVAPTSAGALAGQGIRRIYHAAVASPRPGTNDYDVQPTMIARAVHAAFALARAERAQFSPPLGSVGLPLLGAGRGGLAPATSFAWIWGALAREVAGDSTWDIHFITRRQATADVIIAGITRPAQ
jgi:O-acetyl-ADP-ribose deacetylase (regulator of RNase III)